MPRNEIKKSDLVSDGLQSKPLTEKEIVSIMGEELAFYNHMPQKKSSFIQTFLNLERANVIWENAKILEIACDSRLVCANYFLKRGAKEITTSNLEIDYIEKSLLNSDSITLIQCDGTSYNFEKKFDLIFARAALEHISDIKGLIINLKKHLSPTGVFYIDGGPMWDSRFGHHIWFRTSAGNRYTMADKKCVIKPWEHLLFTEEELYKRLKSRLKNKQDAREISNFIHHDKGQNRYSSDYIIDLFSGDSDLEIHAEKTGYSQPAQELIERYGKGIGYHKLIIYGGFAE